MDLVSVIPARNTGVFLHSYLPHPPMDNSLHSFLLAHSPGTAPFRPHHLELGALQLLSLLSSLGLFSSVFWATKNDLSTIGSDYVSSQLNTAIPPVVFTETSPWPHF